MPPKKTVNTPKKKSGGSKAELKDRIVDAALDCANDQDWRFVSLFDIAQKADISVAELFDVVEDKSDILAAYGRRVDRRVLEAMGQPDADLNMRERLFDILMERFDILNEDRLALQSILNSFRLDPKQAVISLPHLCKSMAWMGEAAGIRTDRLTGAVKLAALTGLYLKTLKVWMHDESEDMAEVMAALDKDLGRIERVASYAGWGQG